ncbi:hypothetical protein [Bacillus gobiensis]|uniref:Uncharacterized protein n=1 Tax=Bacillus gobiensis TaxID=1441095 RepID=A0A0M4FQP0_9BACI|nr:hypothetical protein [Bacillus gobiensis]ALC81548.1 hypothetical protein AM592_08005 [Bacillus gobiensis]
MKVKTKRRRFRVSISTDGSGTGIGIQEWGGGSKIIYIASIYIADHNNWDMGFDYSVQHIKRLVGTEDAIIRMSRKVRNYTPPKNIKIRNIESYYGIKDCIQLSLDALSRKNTIEEEL